MRHLRLGTRGSPLALYQANTVARLLRERAGVEATIVVIKTEGDRVAEAGRLPAPLAADGGKRLFVKEIQDALLAGDVDLAVHSSKDMPAVPPDGLAVVAALPREDPRDAIVLPQTTPRPHDGLDGVTRLLGATPRIGTSSVRRIAQLRRLFPGATFVPVRGNLDTRLRKLDTGEYDALVLAAAGLTRLGKVDRISSTIDADACVPAPGQGIIAVEIRANDTDTRDAVVRLSDPAASTALAAEQAVVRALGGGCQMPVGAYAVLDGTALVVTGVVASPDGTRSLRTVVHGTVDDPQAAGRTAAAELLSQGADEILADVQRSQAASEGLTS
jgi:hydroxymethylbilane synthase